MKKVIFFLSIITVLMLTGCGKKYEYRKITSQEFESLTPFWYELSKGDFLWEGNIYYIDMDEDWNDEIIIGFEKDTQEITNKKLIVLAHFNAKNDRWEQFSELEIKGGTLWGYSKVTDVDWDERSEIALLSSVKRYNDWEIYIHMIKFKNNNMINLTNNDVYAVWVLENSFDILWDTLKITSAVLDELDYNCQKYQVATYKLKDNIYEYIDTKKTSSYYYIDSSLYNGEFVSVDVNKSQDSVAWCIWYSSLSNARDVIYNDVN